MGKNKPLKDVDSAARSRFIYVFSKTFAATSLVGFFAGLYATENPIKGVIIGVITGMIFGIITYLIIEYTGSGSVNFFYGKRKPIFNEFEKYEGDRNQVQYKRSKNENQMALVLVNEILKKAPYLPQALYSKAQIMWEDYHKATDARKLLEKIIEIVPDKTDTYHTWAQTMLDKINSEASSE